MMFGKDILVIFIIKIIDSTFDRCYSVNSNWVHFISSVYCSYYLSRLICLFSSYSWESSLPFLYSLRFEAHRQWLSRAW